MNFFEIELQTSRTSILTAVSLIDSSAIRETNTNFKNDENISENLNQKKNKGNKTH